MRAWIMASVLYVGVGALVRNDEKVALRPKPGVAPPMTFDINWDVTSTSMTAESRKDEEHKQMTDLPAVTVKCVTKLVVTDELEKEPTPRPTFRRTFNWLRRSVQGELPFSAGDGSSNASQSPLEGSTVTYSWQDKKKMYECSALAPDSAGTGLLKDASVELGFAEVLPSAEVTVGESWTVPIVAAGRLLSPVGDLFPLGEAGKRAPAGSTGISYKAASAWVELGLRQLLADPEGEITTTLADVTTDPTNGRLAIMKLALRVKAKRDVTDRLRVYVESGVPEGVRYEYSHALDIDLDGEGLIHWWIDRGYLKVGMIKANVEMKERDVFDAYPKSSSDGVERDRGVSWDAVWKGTLTVAGGAHTEGGK